LIKRTNKTLLLFAYYWPPASGPGVQRWLKFVKYLPEKNWNIIVVTPQNGSYPNIDESLLLDVPENVRVIKTSTIEPFRLFNILSGKSNQGNSTSVGMGDIKGEKSFIKTIGAFIRANLFIPDARKGWVRFAEIKGASLIKKHHIDLVITTGPPHSAHLIGQKLKKRFNIPWIADFRDPWTTIYYNKFLPKSESSKKKDKNLENRVLEEADYVIVVSDGLKREFINRTSNIKVIPNGFDSEDFDQLLKNKALVNEKFTLSYVGNFKVNQNIEYLWKAISELSNSNKDFQSNFNLSFTGNVHEEVLESLIENNILNMVEVFPFVEHSEAIQKMIDADALLFVIPDSEENDKIITGKIFEYLASKTPLLSIGPESGDASSILKECNRSKMIDYSNKEEIKNRLKYLFEQWKYGNKASNSLEISDEHIRFSRSNLTQELTKILHSASNENH